MRSFTRAQKVFLIGIGLNGVGVVLSWVYTLLAPLLHWSLYLEFAMFPGWVLVFGVLCPIIGFIIFDLKYRTLGTGILVVSGWMTLMHIFRMSIYVMYAFGMILYWWLNVPSALYGLFVLSFTLVCGVGGALCMISGISLFDEQKLKVKEETAS